MKICKPYQNCSIMDISQKFGAIQSFDGKPHSGVDFAPYNGYGIFLVAPENCKVEQIIDDLILSKSLEPMERGCGILLKATNSPYYYLFWHCLPIFPVKEGDFVMQKQIVAQMGNTGNVMRNGVYVPTQNDFRPKSKLGTHLHFEIFDTYYNRKYVDPVLFIDWNISVNYGIEGLLLSIKNIATKMIGILRK